MLEYFPHLPMICRECQRGVFRNPLSETNQVRYLTAVSKNQRCYGRLNSRTIRMDVLLDKQEARAEVLTLFPVQQLRQ